MIFPLLFSYRFLLPHSSNIIYPFITCFCCSAWFSSVSVCLYIRMSVRKSFTLSINLMLTVGFVCLLCNLAAFSNKAAFPSLSISSSQSRAEQLSWTCCQEFILNSVLLTPSTRKKKYLKKQQQQQKLKRIIFQPVLFSNCSYPVPVSTGSCTVFFSKLLKDDPRWAVNRKFWEQN